MKMKKKIIEESGMAIVEATIVFPVIFLVIFLMIFAGNAYLQKCRVEAIVNRMAISGAAYCADPLLQGIEGGSIPSLGELDVKPYRYLFGGMESIETKISDEVETRVRGMSTGLFSNMKPTAPVIEVKYNNGFIYSTFSVEIEYKIEIPVRLLGASDFIALEVSTRTDMPVSDTVEFIRNVDMVGDYMDRYGVTEKINEVINKAKEWSGK